MVACIKKSESSIHTLIRCPLQPIRASSSRIAELGELPTILPFNCAKKIIPVLPVPTSTPTWRFSIGPAPLAADSGRSPGFLYLAPFSLTSETPNSSHGGTQAKVRLNKLLVILVLLDL